MPKKNYLQAMTLYKGRITYYDVVNEALCDCVSATGQVQNCEEYLATQNGAEKCGYSEVYNVSTYNVSKVRNYP